jgi:hypothetical protein
MIDGVIFHDGWHEPLRKDSEVFLLPRMVGGQLHSDRRHHEI